MAKGSSAGGLTVGSEDERRAPSTRTPSSEGVGAAVRANDRAAAQLLERAGKVVARGPSRAAPSSGKASSAPPDAQA